MSYLVLARKHRPQTFKDVIGQEHITDLLVKGIGSGRIAHAYLFSGPRGIGKTTCARILAMCLNCEGGPLSTPPPDSPICREIAEGRSFDVLEIDGASNRGIDEVRALRENVKFAPAQGRYKIYIVDEVHMLTTEAFNALLKTLEEPPEHAKFIFATTEPNKVPPTIISRCQRFDFKRIPVNMIVAGLKEVSRKEKYNIDENALFSIAKAAQGSLRDALSILDQLSALGNDGIREEDVYSMLGLVEVQWLFDLVDEVAAKNCANALRILDEIINKGKDVKQLVKDLTEHFRNLLVINIGGKTLGKLVDYPVNVKEMILEQSQRFTLQEILEAIDTLIETQETSRITESVRMPLEVALAKLTYSGSAAVTPARKNDAPVQNKPSVRPETRTEPKPHVNPAQVLKSNKGSMDFSIKPSLGVPDEPAAAEEALTEPAPAVLNTLSPEKDLDHIQKVWDILTSAVSKEKMSVATYLQEGMPSRISGDVLFIGFPPHCGFQKEVLEGKDNTLLIERIFSDRLKAKVVVRFEFIEVIKEAAVDPKVQSALDAFNGKVVNRWHNE
ncbi:MAG: DNA polymerase III subunit gamma/tau [Candidatus Omnitrophota bacterium]